MLKDITIGQYFPGESFVHRLDPRTKLIFVVFYVAALFTAKTWVTYAVVLVVLIASVAVAGIPVSVMLRGLKPLAIIIAFTMILNIFFSSEGNILFSFWVLKITDAGLVRAVYMISRIMMLISGTLLLTYTTTPMSLTDGMERMLSPLKVIHFPVHELSMMMSIALRFIPTLIDETDRIMSAQKARGANFETGKLTERAKALLPLLIPLFVNAFRCADELTIAMESRCYRGGEGRTRMNTLKMTGVDFTVLALSTLWLAGIIILSVRFGL